MKSEKFRKYIQCLSGLTEGQRRMLKEKIQIIENHHLVSKTLETNKENITCPHCSSQLILRWGHQSDLQRYRCSLCKKTFNSLTCTPLAKLRRRGHWWQFCECLVNGYSLRKSAQLCKVDLTTAFRWRHRFLRNHATYYPQILAGIVEVSICEVPTPRFSKQHSSHTKNTEVLISSDRYQTALDKILMDKERSKISLFLSEHIKKDSMICVNSSWLKTQLSKSFQCCNPSNSIGKETVHTGNTQAYEKSLREWLSRFRGVSKGYLANYLAWHRSMDEYSHQTDPKTFLMRAKETSRPINFKRKHKFLEHRQLNPTF